MNCQADGSGTHQRCVLINLVWQKEFIKQDITGSQLLIKWTVIGLNAKGTTT